MKYWGLTHLNIGRERVKHNIVQGIVLLTLLSCGEDSENNEGNSSSAPQTTQSSDLREDLHPSHATNLEAGKDINAPSLEQINSKDIFINWKKPSSFEVNEYKITFFKGEGCFGSPLISKWVRGDKESYIASLADEGMYSFHITGSNQSGEEHRSECSPKFVLDTTPPPVPTELLDGTFQVDDLTQTPELSWSEPVDTTDVAKYQLAVGSEKGKTDVVSWHDIQWEESLQFAITLESQKAYFVSLRSIDKAGNYSEVVEGDGFITIDSTKEKEYIKAFNSDSGDNFGASLAMHGQTLVVGAPFESNALGGLGTNGNDNSSDKSGAAYVFVNVEGNWLGQAYIKAPNPDTLDYFGRKVAIYGNTIAVSAPCEAVCKGAVYIYHREAAVWSLQGTLRLPEGQLYDYFGHDIAIYEDTIVVGAYGYDNNSDGSEEVDIGAAFVYKRENGIWSLQEQLMASNGETKDEFGFSVDIYVDTIAVGAPKEDSSSRSVGSNENGNLARNAGAVYIFKRSDVEKWEQKAYIKSSQTKAQDRFGSAVALSESTLVVGAPIAQDKDLNLIEIENKNVGYVSLFQESDSGWKGIGKVFSSTSGLKNDGFASCVDIDKDIFVVGAPFESTAKGTTGSAVIYKKIGEDWQKSQHIKSSDVDTLDGFGSSIAVTEDFLLVGSPLEDGIGSEVNSDRKDNSKEDSGAVLRFEH